jgi:hypothetical protein
MGEQCIRDDGRCLRCSHGCYEVVPCKRCGEDFQNADMNDGLCPDCAEVVADRREADQQAADDRAAEEAEERRREDAMDEQNVKGAV